VAAPVPDRAFDIRRNRRTTPKNAGIRAVVVSGIVAIAAAVILVAAMALVYSSDHASTRQDIPTGTLAPLPPFFLVGFTYDQGGAILGGCAINITDVTTGAWNNTTVSDISTGYYICDINNGLAGGVAGSQVINVTAVNGALSGANETTLPSVLPAFVQMDITLTLVVIPEFGSYMVPIVGMIGLVAVISFLAPRKKNK